MVRIDCARNQFVAKNLLRVEPIIRATADCEETFGVDDIWYSAGTEDNYAVFPCENKTLLGGYQFKYEGDWNPYFEIGIYNKLNFHKDQPDAGTPIYFVNATDAYGDYAKGKFQKLIDNKASLTFFAPDCIILYTYKMLEDAFLGYADYYVSHTTEYGNNKRRRWETKAIIDLSQGIYIPCDPPIELFEK